MTVAAAGYQSVLSAGIELGAPSAVEGLTRGHWDGFDLPQFPPVGVMFNIEYPIIQEPTIGSRSIYRKYNMEYDIVQKHSTDFLLHTHKLKGKIIDAPSDMSTVVQFLEENTAKPILLVTTGYNPFIGKGEENQVYFTKWSAKRIKPKEYSFEIEFYLDEI